METLHDWKSLSITQSILSEIERRVQQTKDELLASAGLDPLMDRWRVGVISAYSDVLNIELDEESHGD